MRVRVKARARARARARLRVRVRVPPRLLLRVAHLEEHEHARCEEQYADDDRADVLRLERGVGPLVREPRLSRRLVEAEGGDGAAGRVRGAGREAA